MLAWMENTTQYSWVFLDSVLDVLLFSGGWNVCSHVGLATDSDQKLSQPDWSSKPNSFMGEPLSLLEFSVRIENT